MPDIVQVAVTFEVPADERRGLPSYRDTLFIPYGEYDPLKLARVAALKRERHAAWAEQVLHPPKPEPVAEATALELSREALGAAAQAVSDAQAAVEAVQPENG